SPHQQTLWSVTAIPAAAYPQLRGALSAEVAIVGAGYTGLSAALHLSEAGSDVAVLESLDVGDCASGRNGGQVLAGGKHDPALLEDMFGAKLGPQVVSTVAGGPDLVFELIGKHAIACAAWRSGWIQSAVTGADVRLLEKRAAQWKHRGADVSVLAHSELRRL